MFGTLKVDFYGESPVSVQKVLKIIRLLSMTVKKKQLNFTKARFSIKRRDCRKSKNLLSSISEKVDATLNELDKRLPDLVTSIVERFCPS